MLYWGGTVDKLFNIKSYCLHDCLSYSALIATHWILKLTDESNQLYELWTY